MVVAVVYARQTAVVAGLPGSAVGALDLSGNVWEWVGDWFAPDLLGGVDVNGPASGSLRVFRGGGWDGDPQFARVVDRYYITPDFRDNYLGVRLLRTVP